MKQLHVAFVFLGFFMIIGTISRAQQNLPYTLTFSSNDAAKWADGIAGGGEGGSADINGLDLQIYTA